MSDNIPVGIENAAATEAMFWEPRANDAAVCTLCPHLCHIGEGLYGVCGVRRNRGGRIETLIYGLTAAMNVDPIEKKPLFHFLPASKSLSIATVGCNFKCSFCQNYDISQVSKGKNREIFGRTVTPGEVVALAKTSGAKTIAFTYSEPTIFYEYAHDCAKLAAEEGIRGVFVSNGLALTKVMVKFQNFFFIWTIEAKDMW